MMGNNSLDATGKHCAVVLDDDAARRVRRLRIAHARGELLLPVKGVVEIVAALVRESKVRNCDRFSKDLHTILERGSRLAAQVQEAVPPDAAEILAEATASRLNHDLRGMLTVIIGYADDLHRTAQKLSMGEFRPELEQIRRLGERSTLRLDELVALLRGSEPDDGANAGQYLNLAQWITTADTSNPEPGRILVIDDDNDARDVLARLLRGRGHDVSDFANPLAALTSLGDHLPDVVLLDVVMPGANGIDILREFKANPKLSDIPVVMVSGLGDLECVVQCIQMGAEDYVAKPFDRVVLRARVEACLEKKRLRDREAKYLQQIEKERKRSNDLLHVILPKPIVNELRATGRVSPRRHDNVAVLFADVSGFTKWSDVHQPEEVVDRLQKLVELWEVASHANRMLKIKTIGDAYMATAGLLRSVDDPVLACVRCGLAMAEATGSVAPDWKLRVGIHVGPVVAGILGKKRFCFDLWGDTVNTASRVESNGVPGSVCLSKDAWHRVSDRCRLGEEIVLESVKGKGRMTIYRLEGLL
jgi:adenylate cyclase